MIFASLNMKFYEFLIVVSSALFVGGKNVVVDWILDIDIKITFLD